MPADEMAVAGEGDVALDDAGSHDGRGLVGFLGVLRELLRGAAVADGEIGLLERPGRAFLEALLERPRAHALHEVERPRPELHVDAALVVVVVVAVVGEACAGQRAQDRGQHDAAIAHLNLPVGWTCHSNRPEKTLTFVVDVVVAVVVVVMVVMPVFSLVVHGEAHLSRKRQCRGSAAAKRHHLIATPPGNFICAPERQRRGVTAL